ncbi:hypothetical protein ACIGB8_09060 [Promicromonospora sukumoe]|uniref:hypothetical protein n=1 Tax=Promicromonospora sukumoe TaxID=88382 RepID=UPI0037CC6FBA
MSPFGDVVDRLRSDIRDLPQPGQVVLFLAAAQVFAGSRREWLAAKGVASDDAVFEQALESARDLAHGRAATPSAAFLVELEEAAFGEMRDGAPTIVQDCWICLDTAVRGPVEGYDMSSSTWYLLEPLFQSVSARLFGVADLGSENVVAERAALDDPVLAGGVAAVRSCVERLPTVSVDGALFARIVEDLIAIRP